MPSGACVKVNGYTIRIDGIPADKGKVEGTCGNFNGNKYDDVWKKGTNDVKTDAYNTDPVEYYETWK